MLVGPEHHSEYHVRLLNAVGGAIGLGDYLEAGSIAFLFTLADWLESRSSDKVSKTWSLLSKICNYCISLPTSNSHSPVPIVGKEVQCRRKGWISTQRKPGLRTFSE